MVTYKPHGHVPTDDEIAQLGPRAFAPVRPPFEPTVEQCQRALADCATGDVDELGEAAAKLAELWPGGGYGFMAHMYGYWIDDDDL